MSSDAQYEARLLCMIDALLARPAEFLHFTRAYQDYYIDSVPADALSDFRYDFFGDVNEKLDWTTENPDAGGRSYGWMSHSEFLIWLRLEREAYRTTFGP